MTTDPMFYQTQRNRVNKAYEAAVKVYWALDTARRADLAEAGEAPEYDALMAQTKDLMDSLSNQLEALAPLVAAEKEAAYQARRRNSSETE